ncbi:MAG: hypothetical protein VB878_08490 [Pirellulaceae bacterium]
MTDPPNLIEPGTLYGIVEARNRLRWAVSLVNPAMIVEREESQLPPCRGFHATPANPPSGLLEQRP